MDISLFDRTVVPFVTKRDFPSGSDAATTLPDKKQNISVLLSLWRQKSVKFPGIFALPESFLLIPAPRLSLVASFRLFSKYLSHTMSNRVQVSSDLFIHGCTCCKWYSSNVAVF